MKRVDQVLELLSSDSKTTINCVMSNFYGIFSLIERRLNEEALSETAESFLRELKVQLFKRRFSNSGVQVVTYGMDNMLNPY